MALYTVKFGFLAKNGSNLGLNRYNDRFLTVFVPTHPRIRGTLPKILRTSSTVVKNPLLPPFILMVIYGARYLLAEA